MFEKKKDDMVEKLVQIFHFKIVAEELLKYRNQSPSSIDRILSDDLVIPY